MTVNPQERTRKTGSSQGFSSKRGTLFGVEEMELKESSCCSGLLRELDGNGWRSASSIASLLHKSYTHHRRNGSWKFASWVGTSL